MTKQMMIDKIYEKIADKTLSFGCRIKVYTEYCHDAIYIRRRGNNVIYLTMDNGDDNDTENNHAYLLSCKEEEIEIIGHPVMLGDVLDWFYSNIDLPVMERRRTCDTILLERKEKRKPIEEQPDILIEYIHSLLIS